MDSHENRRQLLDNLAPEEPTSLGGVNVAFVAIGLIVVFALAVMGWNSYQTRSWPTTEGTATDGKIEYAPATRRYAAGYSLKVNYSYQVAGTNYSDKTGQFFERLEDANTAKDSYLKKHRKLHVYYNPNQPGECTLTPGATCDTISVGAIGVLFVVVFVVGSLTLAISKYRKDNSPTPESDGEIVSRLHGGPALLEQNNLSDRLDRLSPDD